MKILIPILSFDRTGGYRVLSKLADELIFLGHRVSFLCPDKSNLPYFPTKAEILWINDKGIVSFERKQSFSKENAFTIQQKLAKALTGDIKNRYDIIIANHSLTVLPIQRAGLLSKTIYYVQAYEPDYYNRKNLKEIVLRYFSERSYKMKLFTLVNSGIYLNYKKLSASRILYPGIDFTLFYPGENNSYTKKNKIIIGTIARAEAYKGTRYIIDAFLKLQKIYSDIELHLAFGKKEDFKNVEGIYCFQTDGDKALADFYRSLDYYICAGFSQLGAFHYPVVEAMTCGIPVITTNYYPADETNAWITTRTQDAEVIITQFEAAEKNKLLREEKVQKALKDVKQFEWRSVGLQLNEYIIEFSNKKR